MQINPEPTAVMVEDSDIILIGSMEAEAKFLERFTRS